MYFPGAFASSRLIDEHPELLLRDESAPANHAEESSATIYGDTANSRLGSAIANIGDVNADGFDDFAFGSTTAAGGSGQVHIVFGQASGVPDGLTPGDLDGSNGFSITGASAMQNIGWDVSAAGDFNADGIDDFVMVERYAEGAGTSYRAHVVFGDAGGFGASLTMASFDASNSMVINGFDGDYLATGLDVAGIGDVNADGIADIGIGAYSTERAFVVFGGASLPASRDVDALDAAGGPYGFTVIPSDNGLDSGNAVVAIDAAGDVNGDGIADFVIGFPGLSLERDDAGVAFVVYGNPEGFDPFLTAGQSSSTSASFEGNAGHELGLHVAGIGDFDNDGFDDVAIGGGEGRPVRIYYGGASPYGGTDGDASDRLLLIGPDASFGSAISAVGDVNGDGLADILIGSPDTAETGAAYVIYGRTDYLNDINADGIGGGDGFVIYGQFAGDRFGAAVAFAGDANGAGFDDILVGAPGVDLFAPDSGAAYFFYGQPIADPNTVYGTPDADALAPGGADNTVYAGAGNDTVQGGDGADTIYGQSGDDTLSGNAEGDRLFGGDGADTFRGGPGADYLVGGAGNDIYYWEDAEDTIHEAESGGYDMVWSEMPFHRLFENVEELRLLQAGRNGGGNAGDNFMYGNRSANQFRGVEGDDFLRGYNGDDTLYGDEGNDILRGDQGNDSLLGGTGNDLVWGGQGRDTLAGNGGADTFRWREGENAGNGSNSADRVVDFSAGEGDLIDLSAIDADQSAPSDQAFTWIGTAAFSGARGELRFSQNGGVTMVQGDVNGDGAVDFAIRLDGLIDLTAGDFVL